MKINRTERAFSRESALMLLKRINQPRGKAGNQTVVAPSKQVPPPNAICNPYPRLSIALSGYHRMVISDENDPQGKRKIELERGDICFIPSNGWNVPTWEEEKEVVALSFEESVIRVQYAQLTFKEEEEYLYSNHYHYVHQGPLMGAGRDILNGLWDLSSYEDKEQETEREAINALVEILLRQTERQIREERSDTKRKSWVTWQIICAYLHENYHLPISRKTVAAHFGLHPSHLSRLFKMKGKGCSGFNAYLLECRMKRASYLLKNHSVTIDEVAGQCGFMDTVYFRKCFKRYFKQTPGQYRSRF